MEAKLHFISKSPQTGITKKLIESPIFLVFLRPPQKVLALFLYCFPKKTLKFGIVYFAYSFDCIKFPPSKILNIFLLTFFTSKSNSCKSFRFFVNPLSLDITVLFWTILQDCSSWEPVKSIWSSDALTFAENMRLNGSYVLSILGKAGRILKKNALLFLTLIKRGSSCS